MAESRSKKKVVKAEPAASGAASGSERAWTPTPEAKSQATGLRIMAGLLWLVAIVLEVVTIIWILPKASEKLWLLLVMLVPIAVCAIIGNLVWKKANRLDPASKKDAVRFFIQNQLGAFITVLAFLPLIIFVLLDKNMDGKQKAIAGGLGALVMIAAAATGVSWDGGPSQEQYAEESNIIAQLTGEDQVYWVKGGSVFHVCEDVPDVNKESQDGQIYVGTVAEAHAAGKDRLTKRWESEAVGYCGYTQDQVDAVKSGLSPDDGDAATSDGDATDEDATDDDATDEDVTDQGVSDEETEAPDAESGSSDE